MAWVGDGHRLDRRIAGPSKIFGHGFPDGYAGGPALIVELWVGDAELGDIARNLQPDSVDAVYTDPPWNEGIGKIFRGWADAKDGQFSLEVLMRRTCLDLYRVCPTGLWFLEVGPNDEAWLEHVSAWRDGAVSVHATWG